MNRAGPRGGCMLPFALLMLLASAVIGAVLAAEPPIITGQDFKVDYLLWITDKDRVTPIFKMEPGACLVGPLEFMDTTGKSMFMLGDQVEYPTGCRGANQ